MSSRRQRLQRFNEKTTGLPTINFSSSTTTARGPKLLRTPASGPPPLALQLNTTPNVCEGTCMTDRGKSTCLRDLDDLAREEAIPGARGRCHRIGSDPLRERIVHHAVEESALEPARQADDDNAR